MLLQAGEALDAITAASEASDAWTAAGVLAIVAIAEAVVIWWLGKRLMAKHDADEARAEKLADRLLDSSNEGK